MPEWSTLAVFAVAALLFAVIPGPAVLYVVMRSVAQGRAAGMASVLGIETGNLIHVAAATAGLSALLASSAAAFMSVKYLGAAYLIFLGLRELRGRASGAVPESLAGGRPLPRLYAHGVAVATLNPKTALFFLAFLPQFVNPHGGPAPLQIAVLGILLVAITAASDSAYALLSGAAGGWLRGTRLGRARRLISGGTYLALGASAAVSGARPSAST